MATASPAAASLSSASSAKRSPPWCSCVCCARAATSAASRCGPHIATTGVPTIAAVSRPSCIELRDRRSLLEQSSRDQSKPGGQPEGHTASSGPRTVDVDSNCHINSVFSSRRAVPRSHMHAASPLDGTCAAPAVHLSKQHDRMTAMDISRY